MEINIFSIIFYLLLVDSIGANVLAYGGGQTWWKRNFSLFARCFPLSRGWTTSYLILVLFIGFILNNAGILTYSF